jgi:hypothetical protein
MSEEKKSMLASVFVDKIYLKKPDSFNRAKRTTDLVDIQQKKKIPGPSKYKPFVKKIP